jgi:hypothetical protein
MAKTARWSPKATVTTAARTSVGIRLTGRFPAEMERQQEEGRHHRGACRIRHRAAQTRKGGGHGLRRFRPYLPHRL